MEKYVHGEDDHADELKAAVRKGHRDEAVPGHLRRAFKNKGVQALLDAVIDYLPSPLDIPPVTGRQSRDRRAEERKASDDGRSPRWRSRS